MQLTATKRIGIGLAICALSACGAWAASADQIARQRLEVQRQLEALQKLEKHLDQLKEVKAKASDHNPQTQPAPQTKLPAEPTARQRTDVLAGTQAPDNDPSAVINLSVRTGSDGEKLYTVDSNNVSLWRHMRKLAEQSDVPICVDEDIPQAALSERISVCLQDVTMLDLLEIVLGTQELDYRFDGRSVFIAKGPKLGYKSQLEYLEARADKTYRQALVKFPDDPAAVRAYYSLGESHLRHGEPYRAAARFRSVIAKFPSSALARAAQFKLGGCFAQLGDYALARESYLRFLDQFSADALADEAYLEVGKAWEAQGKLDKAMTAYRTVLRSYPESNSASQAELALADCLFRSKRYDEATAVYDHLAKQTQKVSDRVQATYRACESCYQAKKPARASVRFKRFLANYGDTDYADDAYYRLGDCCLEAKQYLEAVKAYEDALTRFPNSEHALGGLFHMGQAYAKLGLFTQAIKPLAKALERFDQAAAEDVQSGQAEHKQAEARRKTIRQIQSLMGDCYLAQDQYVQAESFYATVAGRMDDAVGRHAALAQARCLYERDKHAEAIEVCKKVIAEAHKARDIELMKQALKLAGDCYMRLGMFNQANKAYEGHIVVTGVPSSQ